MEFKETKFDITSNISLIVSLAYYEGHPVVETKKTKINYKGTLIEVNRENKNNIVLADRLIPKSLRSIFSIELVNYLNRLINGENLYEVYLNNSNKADRIEELIDYVFKPEETLCGAAQRDIRSKYIDHLMNDHGDVDLDLLDQHRNPKFPTCVHNFEEIDYVPIYNYIHPTLAKNQGSTIHIMHLGLLFQLLTRIKGLPEFNTQATMALLTNSLQANENEESVEELNKRRYEEIVEENKRLLADNKKKQDKIDKLIKKVDKLRGDNKEMKEMIDELYCQTSSAGVLLRRQNKKMDAIKDAVVDVKEEVCSVKRKDKKLNRTKDALILYTSPDKPKLNEYRDHTPEGYVWISTFNGQAKNFRYPNVPKNRTVIFESESNRLDSFKGLVEDEVVSSLIRQITPQRDMLVRTTDIEDLCSALETYLNKEDDVETVTNLDEVVNEKLEQTSRERVYKRNLMHNHSPLLIMVSRYRRRLYCKVNDELVLIEQVPDAYKYEWFYRFGTNGSKIGEVDLDMLMTSKLSNEIENRLTYE